MKKLLIGMVLSFCAINAHAWETSIDTTGLSGAQIAEIKAIAASKSAEAAKANAESGIPKDPVAAATLATTWGTQAAVAAEGFSKALAIAAKELGITINEFLNTPAGKLTAALIIWKVVGTSAAHMLYGVIVVSSGLGLARVLYLRLFTAGYKQIEYNYFGGLFKGAKMVRIPKSFAEMNRDGEWLMIIFILVIVFVTLLTGSAFF